MKTRTKIISLFLSLFVILSVFTLNVSADTYDTTTSSSSSETASDTSSNAEEDDENFLEKILNGITTISIGISEILNPTTFLGKIFAALSNFLCDIITHFLGTLNETMTFMFFENAYVAEFLDFFYFLGWIILGCGFIAALVKFIDKSRHGEITQFQDMFEDFFIASGVIFLAKYGVLFFNSLSHKLVTDLTNVSIGNVWDSEGIKLTTLTGTTGASSVVWFLVVLIIILICSIIVLWSSLKRHGVLLLQIVTGYFYAFDLAAGNRGVLGEWVRDVLSGCITFSLQMILYQIGMRYASAGLLYVGTVGVGGLYNSNLILGIVFLATAGSVPSVMKRWGYANQHGSGKVAQTAYMAMSAARLLA